MIEGERFVYPMLQKTGCTHIERILLETMPGIVRYPRHSRPTDEVLAKGKLMLGSVRNPWDYYVSHWAFGCGHRGRLYREFCLEKKLTGLGFRGAPFGSFAKAVNIWKTNRQRRGDRSEWARLYSDPLDPELFRAWLKKVMSFDVRTRLPFGYDRCTQDIGYYTYCYLHLYHREIEYLYGSESVELEELQELDKTNNGIDYIVRTESLREDFKYFVQRGIATEMDWKKLERKEKTNVSQRLQDYKLYYDPETYDLVGEKDAFLIKKYSYA